jgi:hypothetical protein
MAGHTGIASVMSEDAGCSLGNDQIAFLPAQPDNYECPCHRNKIKTLAALLRSFASGAVMF